MKKIFILLLLLIGLQANALDVRQKGGSKARNVTLITSNGATVNATNIKNGEIMLNITSVGTVTSVKNGDNLTSIATQTSTPVITVIKSAIYNGSLFNGDFAQLSTTNLTEGTNQYFTNERVDDRVNGALLVGSNKLSKTYDDAGNSLTLDVNQGNLTLSSIGGSVTDAQVPDTISLTNITQIGTRSHTSLTDIGSNTHTQIDTHISNGNIHINHGGVILTAGSGLTGGGDISASRTFNLATNGSLVVTNDKVQLNGDSASPGNSRYYGTDGSGVKGWISSLTGTVTSVGINNGDLGLNDPSSSPVTSSGIITLTTNGNLLGWAAKVRPSGVVIGTTDTQTLTNKTIQAGLLNGTTLFKNNSIAKFNGSVLIPASAGAGKILTSDINGYASWVTPTGGGDMLGANNLSEITNSATARTNLGLVIGTNVQAYDAELAALAGVTSAANKLAYFTGSGTATTTDLTLNGRNLLDDTSIAAQRTTIGLGNVENTALSTWAGTSNITTVGTIDTGEWSGTAITVSNGGTGATSASSARTNLGLAIGSNVQAWDADLDSLALKAIPTTLLVGNGDTQTLTNKTLISPTINKALVINGTTFSMPALTQGDLMFAKTTSTVKGLAKGTNHYTLKTNGNTLAWENAPAFSNNLSAFASTTSAQLAGVISDEVGTGRLVFNGSTTLASPTFITPVLGTPSSGTLTSCTGLPVSSGISGLGTGVATWLATPTTANFAAAVTGEVGTGAVMFNGTPLMSSATLNKTTTINGNTLSIPALGQGSILFTKVAGAFSALDNGASSNHKFLKVNGNTLGYEGVGALGAATATTINKYTFTQPATGATLTIADGKTLTANNTLSFSGTDSTVMTFPTTSATIARTDAANTFTGVQTMTSPAITTPAITGLATGSGVASAATVSTLMLRDSSANTYVDNLIEGYTTTATAAGTTTLAVGDTYQQFFTGSTTQTVTLPVTSTLTLGHSYLIVNNSTGLVTVNSSGGNAVVILAGSTSAIVTCILTSGTSAASWSVEYFGDVVTSGKKLSVSNSLTFAGTDSTTMTFPSTSATIARTDAANTFTGVQTMTSPVFTTPVLGTPSSGTLTSCTGLPVSTGISGLGTGVATLLATPSSANLLSAITDEVGTGRLVFNGSTTLASPTFINPTLGTPASGTLTNATGLPISSGVSGLGSGVATALATPSSANFASAWTDEVGTGKILLNGTPLMTSATLNKTTTFNGNTFSIPVLGQGSILYSKVGGAIAALDNGAASNHYFLKVNGNALSFEPVGATTGTGAYVLANTPTLITPVLGVATATSINSTTIPSSKTLVVTTDGLGVHASTTSASLAGVISDEVGTGRLVFNGSTTLASPTFINPTLGTPASGTLTNATGLPISSGVSGLGSNVATFLATATSANLASAVSDEVGTGRLTFNGSPTFSTPVLGSATATKVIATGSVNGATLNATTGNITNIAATKMIATGSVNGATITATNVAISNGLYQMTEVSIGNGGSAKSINVSKANFFLMTLNGTTCAIKFTPKPTGATRFVLGLKQFTGGKLATWNGDIAWPSATAPTLSTTTNYIDFITCVYSKVNAKFYCQATLDIR